MIYSMWLDGITACIAIEVATHTEVFRTHARQVFIPWSRPGEIIVMDNQSPIRTSEPLP